MSRGTIGLGLWIVTAVWSMGAWAEPQINLGNIPAGKAVTITYDVLVNNDASGNQFSSQATVSGANFASLVTNDPATGTANDATVTAIDSATTSVGLNVSDTSPTSSEMTTFTAQVTTDDINLATPTGNVEFLINGSSVSIVAVDAFGEASYSRAFSVGNYTVTANYLGNAEHAPATANTNIVAVPASTTTTIDSVSSSSVYPGDTVTFNFSVVIEAVASGLPVAGTVEISSGSESCSADVSFGSCSIQFNSAGTRSLAATYSSSSPELNGSISSAVNVEVVNNPPVISPVSNLVVTALDQVSFLVEATDPDPAAVISYSLGGGAPVGANINSSTGMFSWTPTEAQGGITYQISIMASDQFGASDNIVVSITVNALDSPPVLNDDFIVTEEDTFITFNPLNNDDEDNSFDLSSLVVITEPSSGMLQVNTLTGEMTYTPSVNYNGSDLAQYQIKDDAGNQSNIGDINFTINSVNDMPVITSTPVLTVVESLTYAYEVQASDVDGQPLQITPVVLPNWLQLVGSQITGVPTQSELGPHNVTIEVSDGIDKIEQNFTITVISAISNDLSIEQEVSTLAPLMGESFDITYSISSAGPDQARNASLAIELTGEVEILVSDSRCAVNLNIVNCALGTIAANQSEDVTISLIKYNLGDIYSYANIESADDTTLHNNETGLGVSITQELMSQKGQTVGEAASQTVVTGDINNDGLDDIILLKGVSSIGSSFINDGVGNFNKGFDIVGEETVVAAKLALINGDSHLDLVVATADNQPTLLYLGDGTGNFIINQVLGVADSNALGIADLDGDGLSDVVVANNGPDEIYINQGNSLLLSHLIDVVNNTALVLTDVNGDGLVDGLFSAEDGTSRFYQNDQLLDVLSPPNNYISIATGVVSNITSIDINNDGLDEIIFAGAINQGDRQQIPSNKIYTWNGSFDLLQSFGRMDSAQVLASDIDDDGDADLFIMNKSGAHQIYLNESGIFELASKLLINEAATFASWVKQNDGIQKDLILAEDLIEGSALYINQGNGEFGQAISDLTVEALASAASVNEQGVVTLQITVENNGPSIAQSVQLETVTNSNVSIAGFGSGEEGCVITQDSMTCSLDNLAIGEIRQIPLRVVAIGIGQGTVTSSVSTQSLDPVTDNNQAQITLTINPKKNVNSGGGHTGLWLLIVLGLMLGRRRSN